MRYRFGQFELDAGRYELWRAGKLLSVQPKVFELLRYLIEHQERVVTQRELLDVLWAGQHVGETSVPWTVRQARRVLGQRNGERGPIETVHARGYRWLGAAQPLEPVKAQPGHLPFVGRQPLMAAMERVLESVQVGRGGFVVLLGDAGIGKTRCMEELAEGARTKGYRVWNGRCTQDSAAPVYAPWIQALRSADEPAFSELLSMFGPAPTQELPNERSVARSGHALFEAVSRLLIESGRAHPCVLLLDDLHWADSGTLELLSFVAAELRNAPVLIVAASRTSLDLTGETLRVAQRYELAPLTGDDVADYFRAVVGEGEPSDELCLALQRVSAGYPLFLEETLRSLLARHHRATIAALDASQIAPSSHAVELLRARLSKLPAEARAALSCASVIGEAFDLASLVELSGVLPEALLQALDAAKRSDFVSDRADQGFSFRHSLFRDIVYEQVPLAERLRLHRAAALALQARADANSRSSEIARHFHRSLALGDAARVCTAALEAARVGSSAAAYADAAQFAGWALEALALDKTATHRAYAELLLFRAQAQRCAGSPDEARKTLEQLVTVASQHAYADLLVRAARSLRLSHGVGVVPDALARKALERVIELRTDELDELRIQAQCMLAWLPPDSYDMQQSKRLSEQALARARHTRNPDALDEALIARLYALSGPDDIANLLALTDEILERDPMQNPWLRIEALAGRHTALLHRGDSAGAQAAIDTLRELASACGHLDVRWHCDRHRVQSLIAQGDFAKANAELARLETHAARIRLGSGVGLVAQLRAAIADWQQGPGASTGLSAFARYRSYLVTSQFRTTLQASMLRRELELGQSAAARSGLDALAADDFLKIPKNLGYLHSLCNLSLLAIGVDDQPHAERLYELLTPYEMLSTLNEFAISDGPVAFFLALLAAKTGRDAEAERYFSSALARAETLGHRPQLARTYLELARFMLRSSTRAMRGRGSGLCQRAAELATALDMPWLTDEARALACEA